MEQDSTNKRMGSAEPFSAEAWFDPIEVGVRERVRGFIEELLEQELTRALGRNRHERTAAEPKGHRNGSRERQLFGLIRPGADQRAARASEKRERWDPGVA